MILKGKTQSQVQAERLTADIDSARAERNARLSACDWTQVADAPVSKPDWAKYRQALRDITNQPDFPTTIVWPDKPQDL